MRLFLVAVGLIGVSISGPVMAATAAPALAIAFWRNALAAIAIAPVALGRHRTELVSAPQRVWLMATFAGVMLAAHFGFWVTSLTLTSVAAAVALVAMQVLWVLVFQAFAGQRFNRAVVIGALVAVAGVLFITGVDFGLSPQALIGDLFALLGGAFAAAYVVAGAHAREAFSTTSYTLICYSVCALALVVVMLIFQVPLTGWTPKVWLLIVVVTIGAQLLGHSVFNHLLGVMSPVIVSLVLLLEVPLSAGIAALFLHESLPLASYFGLLLILVGLGIVTKWSPSVPRNETLIGD